MKQTVFVVQDLSSSNPFNKFISLNFEAKSVVVTYTFHYHDGSVTEPTLVYSSLSNNKILTSTFEGSSDVSNFYHRLSQPFKSQQIEFHVKDSTGADQDNGNLVIGLLFSDEE